MLKAYFDETGTNGGAPITGIGGLVGSSDAWLALETPWQAILDEFKPLGVTWFHMSEALLQTGQYARMQKPFLNRLIKKIAEYLGEQSLTGFFSSVVTADWHVTGADARFRERFPEPVDLCFENIIQHLWRWGRQHADGEPIIPTFAHHPSYSDRMAALARCYGAHEWYNGILGPIAFDHPQQVIPLQAADLIAHQMNWEATKRLKPFRLSDGGPTWALNRATNGKFVHGNLLDADGLLLTMARFRDAGYPSGPVTLF